MDSCSSSNVKGATTGVGIFLIFLLILYRFLINKMKSAGGQARLPPGPRPWPIVGNLRQLGRLPHQSLADLAKKYGNIMFLRFGSVPTVVISSPSIAKEFLKTHDLVFANRPVVATGKYMAYDHKDVAFAGYGEYWRQMRKLCTIELFTVKRTESFKSVREEEVSSMVRSIWLESGEGMRSVDVTNRISSLAQNIVCRMFSGRTFSDDELNGGVGFKDMLSEMAAVAGAFVIGDYIRFLEWFDLEGIRRRMRVVQKIFDGFAEKVIDEHINRRREKSEDENRVKDMVDVLLDMAELDTQTPTEMQITRVHIKAIILDMLNAGIETSSTTVEWAMSEVLGNPHILVRAQQEIESVVGRDRKVKEDDVASFDYLRCIVKETFRLHPPFPLLIPHESMEGCNVGDYYVPPKTRVFINVWAMGRDGSIWEDPYEFNPERFMGKGNSKDVRGQDFDLLPFGTGRRGCPGILMGLSVVELALAQLLHCFHWSVEGKVNMDEIFGLTVPRKFPLLARPASKLPFQYLI
uniref:CYP750C18 n=1 Tax=Taxus chinensis TaxID=29808 RepID=A0A291FAX1_TAXCH|nr:CYP750C18 [Taxus chinensis]